MLLIDVGNSRIKVATAPTGNAAGVRLLGAAPHGDAAALETLLAKANDDGGAAIASVNPGGCEAVAAALGRRGTTFALWRSDGALFRSGLMTADLATPDTTGVDRVLSAIAALTRAPDCHAIVVDCGSATTVNLSTADRVFRGGAIFPGLQTMFASLRLGTAALPEVAAAAPAKAPAKSTLDAIAAGVFAAALGGIDRLLAEMTASSDKSKPMRYFITGGEAATLAPHLPDFLVPVPTLVLEGLCIAAGRSNGADEAPRV